MAITADRRGLRFSISTSFKLGLTYDVTLVPRSRVTDFLHLGLRPRLAPLGGLRHRRDVNGRTVPLPIPSGLRSVRTRMERGVRWTFQYQGELSKIFVPGGHTGEKKSVGFEPSRKPHTPSSEPPTPGFPHSPRATRPSSFRRRSLGNFILPFFYFLEA